MNILILYGTYSGGTLEVSEEIAKILKNVGHSATVENIISTSESGEYILQSERVLQQIKSHDLVILGSCTWFEDGEEGQMHSGFRALEKEIAKALFEGSSFAIFGLGDSNYAMFCKAVTHLEKFVKDRQGTLAGPSLRINRYYFNQEDAKQTVGKWVKELLLTLQEKPRS